MFQLVTTNGETIEILPGSVLQIGRGDPCEIRLDDPSVSRVQCRIELRDGQLILTDLSSRWGTFVNDRQVQQVHLRPRDRITVGETVMTVHVPNAHGQTTVAPARRPGPELADGESPVERTVSANESSPENPPISRNSIIAAASGSLSSGAAMSVQESQFLGGVFQHYRILRTLAATQSGIVFEARDKQTGMAVALKLFHPDYFQDERAEQRFERAVHVMFDKRHPGIVSLLNAGRQQGYCFTVSQLVEGESAVGLIRRIGVAGMLEPSVVLQIAVDLCEALRFAEQLKVVHRNIKPSNVLIRSKDGAALLNDLVLAKATDRSGRHQMTQAGELPGDICYQSPELLGSSHPVDHRSDIYQLGATLYVLLTGRSPVEGVLPADMIRRVLTESVEPVQTFHMAVPAQFDTLVLKMLKKNPRDRFQSADELANALQKIAAETGQSRVRPRVADPNDPGWAGALDGMF